MEKNAKALYANDGLMHFEAWFSCETSARMSIDGDSSDTLRERKTASLP